MVALSQPLYDSAVFRTANLKDDGTSPLISQKHQAVATACISLVLLCCLSGQSLAADDDIPAKEALDFVREKVQPLLQSRCSECHSAAGESKGGLRLTSRKSMLIGGDSGPTIVPHKPEESLLISAIKYESFEMPPRSRLPDGEIQILERWVEMGAPWPTDHGAGEPELTAEGHRDFPMAERINAHWVWQPIRDPEVPKTSDTSWIRNDIDHFIIDRLEKANLRPTTDADRRSLLRRLYFDLVGLPPTIEQQNRFINNPADDDTAIAELVQELLQSEHFGERWGRHWLDLVRYAETLGHEFDYPLPYAWKYRDYVIRAFNEDVPYDQFIREHIAGDLLTSPRQNTEHAFNESIIATGFWFLGEDKHAPVDVKGEEAARVDNQLDVFSRAFLGLTISCARCHDHKFDAITTEDYYALSGFLQSSRRRIEWLDRDRQLQSRIEAIQQHRQALEAIATEEALKSSADDVAQRLQNILVETLSTEGRPNRNGRDAQFEVGLIDDKLNPAVPLSLLAQLASDSAGKSESDSDMLVMNSAGKWSSHIQALATAQSAGDSEMFADFSHGLPDGWLVYGQAFASHNHQSLPNREGVIRWNDSEPAVTLANTASSAELAKPLKGILQSPTFKLRHPEIMVLVSGKNTRLRLVIDGYVMNEFSELLFRGARQTIDTDGQYRWIRLAGDVHRYLGHQCYLEFLDEGEGWFDVREVRFMTSSGSKPPASAKPSVLNLQLATDIQQGKFKNASSLLHSYAKRLRHDTDWVATASRLNLLPSFVPPGSPTAHASVSTQDATAANQSTAVVKHKAEWKSLTEDLSSGDPILVMCDGSSEDEHLFIRGSHRNLGALVPRRFLTALSSESQSPQTQSPYATTGSGRLQLAEDVLRDDNPLTARVAVNRVWQHLLGEGLVTSADNFGVLGSLPTHPDLLDHLATRFRDRGWSIKEIIQYVVLSRTYRMSSQKDSDAEVADPANALLHRANVRRLEGEIIRDSMLAVSGRLQPTVYGPPVPTHLTEFMQGRGRPGTNGPLDGDGRRSIYQSVNRNFLSPFMLAFDTPAPATTVGRRSTSNVPAQALILLNNEFVAQQANLWAKQLLLQEMKAGLQDGSHATSLIHRAFQQCFARLPSKDELALMVEFTKNQASEYGIAAESALTHEPIVADLCHVLMNQKEFVFLD